MAIDPNSIGAVTEPMLFEWTDRDTLLYAIGVGAGTGDLAFTTELFSLQWVEGYRRSRHHVWCFAAGPRWTQSGGH